MIENQVFGHELRIYKPACFGMIRELRKLPNFDIWLMVFRNCKGKKYMETLKSRDIGIMTIQLKGDSL